LEGHSKNQCPQRDPERLAAPPVIVPTVDFEQEEILEANEDEEADDDDDEGENEDDIAQGAEEGGDKFPPQLHCVAEDEWEDVRCVEEEFNVSETGGRVHPNLEDILPRFDARRSGARNIPPRCRCGVS
jgi:hypothetical protein